VLCDRIEIKSHVEPAQVKLGLGSGYAQVSLGLGSSENVYTKINGDCQMQCALCEQKKCSNGGFLQGDLEAAMERIVRQLRQMLNILAGTSNQ